MPPMKQTLQFETIQDPELSLMDFFEQRLEEFNIPQWEVKKKIPIVIQVKNDQGEILAGVSAKTFGYWLLIENLWVSEALRGQDLGSQILSSLEAEAKIRGCQYALLDTLNFQARPFYEKFGYKVAWTQEQYPKIGCKFFMTKELSK
jgi:GNAT superfamily N-acetyltransferase